MNLDEFNRMLKIPINSLDDVPEKATYRNHKREIIYSLGTNRAREFDINLIGKILPHYNYKLKKRLGNGKTREVFEVEQKVINEYFKRVIKIPFDSYDIDSVTGKRNFLNNMEQVELNAFKDLNHNNIIQIIDAIPYYNKILPIEQNFGGISLESFINENESLQDDKKVKIMLEICEGINHMHNNGYLHRDIKSSNVLIDPDSFDVKITDLQNACKIDDINEKFQPTIGGAKFTDVDLLLNIINQVPTGYSIKNEIYSVGSIFYQLLAGKNFNNFKLVNEDGDMYVIEENEKLKETDRQKIELKNNTMHTWNNDNYIQWMKDKNQLKLKETLENIDERYHKILLKTISPSHSRYDSIDDLIKDFRSLKPIHHVKSFRTAKKAVKYTAAAVVGSLILYYGIDEVEIGVNNIAKANEIVPKTSSDNNIANVNNQLIADVGIGNLATFRVQSQPPLKAYSQTTITLNYHAVCFNHNVSDLGDVRLPLNIYIGGASKLRKKVVPKISKTNYVEEVESHEVSSSDYPPVYLTSENLVPGIYYLNLDSFCSRKLKESLKGSAIDVGIGEGIANHSVPIQVGVQDPIDRVYIDDASFNDQNEFNLRFRNATSIGSDLVHIVSEQRINASFYLSSGEIINEQTLARIDEILPITTRRIDLDENIASDLYVVLRNEKGEFIGFNGYRIKNQGDGNKIIPPDKLFPDRMKSFYKFLDKGPVLPERIYSRENIADSEFLNYMNRNAQH